MFVYIFLLRLQVQFQYSFESKWNLLFHAVDLYFIFYLNIFQLLFFTESWNFAWRIRGFFFGYHSIKNEISYYFSKILFSVEHLFKRIYIFELIEGQFQWFQVLQTIWDVILIIDWRLRSIFFAHLWFRQWVLYWFYNRK